MKLSLILVAERGKIKKVINANSFSLFSTVFEATEFFSGRVILEKMMIEKNFLTKFIRAQIVKEAQKPNDIFCQHGSESG